MKNWRNDGEAIHRPSGPVTAANNPIRKEPETLTKSVPHGNVWPTVLAINPEAHQRARLPNPPPKNIHHAFHIDVFMPYCLHLSKKSLSKIEKLWLVLLRSSDINELLT
jgi:hypothetical protein